MAAKKAAPEAPVLKNIEEAIIWIMSQVGYVQKKRTAGLSYSFAGEVALIQALRPYMVEAGVFIHVENVSNVVCREYQTSKGTAMTDVSLDLVAKFTHAPSGTFILAAARGQGADTGDKATNKASTCAYKYILRQTFCIETGDDPDEFASTVRKTATTTVVATTGSAAKTETLDEAKKRLKAELAKECPTAYPDGAAIGAAMNAQTPPLTFTDPAQYAVVKAKLVASAQVVE
jgi:hypothetical protein